MKKLFAAFVVFFWIICHASFGQSAATAKNLYEIENHARIGDRNALRDLGTFLDNPRLRDLAQHFLWELTLFTTEEIDFSVPISKQFFLDFFYTNQSKIQYSQLMNVFYITPIESQNTVILYQHTEKENTADHSEELMKLIHELSNNIDKNNWQNAEKNVEAIANFKLKEGFEFLLHIADKMTNRTSKKNPKRAFLKTLCWSLRQYDTIETVRTLLLLAEKQNIEASEVLPTVSQLTNYALHGEPMQVIDQYSHLLDSLQTLNAVRNAGYDQQFAFKKQFFYENVDYLAMVMMQSGKLPWSRFNAVRDLAATHHPRSLYYLAAQSYKERFFQSDEDFYMEWIKRLTRLSIKTPDKRTYLRYWASNHQHFEWDEVEHAFVQKEEHSKRLENNDRLFRHLNSENDTVAMESFRKLTEVEPIVVQQLMLKYKHLMRTYKAVLPPLCRPYLENLAEWTKYCANNQIHYQLPPELRVLCTELLTNLTPKARYALENQIIHSLTEKNITALEYWACLQVQNREANFSLGRIVHYFYANNLANIFKNHRSFLLYLKKTALLERVGAYGVSRTYIKPLQEANEKIKKKLTDLQATVADADIQELIVRIFASDRNVQDYTDLDTAIASIQHPNEDIDLANIFVKINKHADIAIVPKLMPFLRSSVSFSLTTDSTTTVTQATASVLNTIYHASLWANHTMPTDWIARWEQDSSSFRTWGKQLYTEQQKYVKKNNASLSIEQLNSFAASPYFEANDKPFLMKTITKNIDATNVRFLRLPFKLGIKTDLSVFKHVHFSHKDLDDLPKFFESKGCEEIMLNFLIEKSKNFNAIERGMFVNAIFHQDWLLTYLRSGKTHVTHIDFLRTSLQKYLDENNNITEYEEQITVLNLAQLANIGASTEVQINYIMTTQTDAYVKDKILGELLARLDYTEIATLTRTLPPEEMHLLAQVLQNDFGLPIFDMEQVVARDTLIARHTRLSEYDFYVSYLMDFGLKITDSKGNLDYTQLYNILHLDLTMPFCDETAELRGTYVYGVIKLLEAKFGTSLGFHAKLNENQTFYTYSAAKRAVAWKAFLKKRKLVDNG